MLKHVGLRSFLAIAIIAATALIGSPSADAKGPKMTDKVELDDSYQGWSSNGMNLDQAACGPFDSSEDAVVWHMYVDLPEGTEASEVKDAKVKFDGKVVADIVTTTSDERVNLWARVTVKDPNKADQIRRGAHTSVKSVEIKFDDKVIPKGSDVAIMLGNVCYLGLGPIGEINITLQAQVCDGYDRFKGNEIDDNTAQWDATGGNYLDWRKVYDRDAPTVKFQKKPAKGCAFDSNQQFATGTTPWMADYYLLPGTTSADDGSMTISSRDLPEVQQRSLFWVHDQLWFQWVANNDLGAIQCYEDSMHADTVEWIYFEDYDKLPKDIYCIAWTVDNEPADTAF